MGVASGAGGGAIQDRAVLLPDPLSAEGGQLLSGLGFFLSTRSHLAADVCALNPPGRAGTLQALGAWGVREHHRLRTATATDSRCEISREPPGYEEVLRPGG